MVILNHQMGADKGKFNARVMLERKVTKDNVVLNSWRQDFADTERAIDLVRDSLNQVDNRRVYNIFGETIEILKAYHGGGSVVNVTEVLALILSMQDFFSAVP
jgi:hypothetical protein